MTKRPKGMSFEDYKAERKAANAHLKRYLHGTYVWVSKWLVEDPETGITTDHGRGTFVGDVCDLKIA